MIETIDTHLKKLDDVFESVMNHLLGPSTNLKETDKNFVLELSVPGLQKNLFKISVEDNQLNISYEKEDSKEKDSDTYHFKQFSSKSFSRSFRLSKSIDPDNISASYENGILIVTVPKKETPPKTGKKVEVK